MHGVLDSSDAWGLNYENKSLCFILANLGYDVWLGNNRGNKYSKKHRYLNPKEKEFWNFTFHEMGQYDLPAIIKFIQKNTKSTKNKLKKITYLGHSMGTTTLFIGLILFPDFFQKSLNGFIAMGPVTSLRNLSAPLVRELGKSSFTRFLYILGYHEVFSNKGFLGKLTKLTCVRLGILCSGIMDLIHDYSPKNDDYNRFIAYMGHYPSGTSLNTMKHLAQLMNFGFGRFGTKVPYDFSKIKNVPIVLIVGKDDTLATPQDNRILKIILEKQGVLNFYKEYRNTGHTSFFISKSNIFMKDVVEKINEFSKDFLIEKE